MTWAYSSGVLTQSNEAGKAFTAVADVTGGIRITAAAHGYAVGDYVWIDSGIYEGGWFVSAVPDANNFDIAGQYFPSDAPLAFTATATGTVARGDKNLTGLSGRTGVTHLTTGAGAYRRDIYYINTPAVRCEIGGALFQDPDVECVIFATGCGPLEWRILTAGHHAYGRARFDAAGRKMLPAGTGLIFSRTPATDWNGPLHGCWGAETSARFAYKGGVIVLSGTLNTRDGNEDKRWIDGTAWVLAGRPGSLFQGWARVKNIRNMIVAAKVTPGPAVSFESLQADNTFVLRAGALAISQQAATTREIFDLDATQNIEPFDVRTDSNLGLVAIALINPRAGSAHRQSCIDTVLAQPTRTNTLAMCYRRVLYQPRDAAGDDIAAGALYTRDTNNGNRKASGAWDFTADRTYEIAAGATADILTAVTYRYEGVTGSAGAYDTAELRVDRRSKEDVQGATSVSDPFDLWSVIYGYQPALLPDYALIDGTVGTLTIRPQHLPDLGITEDDAEAVAAYTAITSETATGATLAADATVEQVYNRRKWYEEQNPAHFWANGGTMCSSAAGQQRDFDGDYTLTLNAVLSGGKWSGGRLVLGTNWGIECPVDGVTLVLPAAGTYDLRGVALSGTITLDDTAAGPVLVKLPPGVAHVIEGLNVTVEVSRELTITAANIPAGAAVRLYNVTQAAELEIEIGTAGAGWATTVTVTEGGSVEVGDTLRIDAIRAVGTSYSRYYTAQAVVGATGDWQVIEPWLAWPEATALGVDGATVLDFATDYANVQIDIVEDPQGYWRGAELIAFILHKTATEADGMRAFFGALQAQNAARWVVDVARVNLRLDNLSADSADQADEVIVTRSDGSALRVQPTTGGGGIGVAIANDVPGLLRGVLDAQGYTAARAPNLDNLDATVSSAGVTPQDKTDIIDGVIVAANTTPIHADIRKVNSYAVDGTGTDLDPWGPV